MYRQCLKRMSFYPKHGCNHQSVSSRCQTPWLREVNTSALLSLPYAQRAEELLRGEDSNGLNPSLRLPAAVR